MADLNEHTNLKHRQFNTGAESCNIIMPYRQRNRINALRLLVGCILLLFAVTVPPPAIPIITYVLGTGGQAAIVLAIVGRAWALLYVGERKNSELVMTGPYSITRNPLYLFSLIGIAGIASQTGSMLLLLMTTISAYAVFSIAIRGEEQYLKKRFGHQYGEYLEETPRLLPDLSLWRDSSSILLQSSNAVAGFKDGIVFGASWLVLKLINVGHAQGLLPAFATLPF